MESLKGKIIGGCRVLTPIGHGGMGSVYKAHHENLDIPVALKILDHKLANSEQVVERFVLEARAAARLDSPHIIKVLQVGYEAGVHFIQMEYVEGDSLAKILKDMAPLDLGTSLLYLYQITLGLDVAHSENIIHRDIKPANIILNKKGICKIADFGLAKTLQASSVLTQPGEILGTPYYLSPEQCHGEDADCRSDIYSLGVTFYYMITGKLPLTGESPLATLMVRVSKDPIPPRQLCPDIPENLENLTLKMMARDPKNRYQNTTDLLQDIIPILTEFSVNAPLATSFILAPQAKKTPKDAHAETQDIAMAPEEMGVYETQESPREDTPSTAVSLKAPEHEAIEEPPKIKHDHTPLPVEDSQKSEDPKAVEEVFDNTRPQEGNVSQEISTRMIAKNPKTTTAGIPLGHIATLKGYSNQEKKTTNVWSHVIQVVIAIIVIWAVVLFIRRNLGESQTNIYAQVDKFLENQPSVQINYLIEDYIQQGKLEEAYKIVQRLKEKFPYKAREIDVEKLERMIIEKNSQGGN